MTLRNVSTGAVLSLRGAAVPRGTNLDAFLAHGWGRQRETTRRNPRVKSP
jgi:hypothetical protein